MRESVTRTTGPWSNPTVPVRTPRRGAEEVETDSRMEGVMLKFDPDCCVVVVSGVRGCESKEGTCDSCMDLQEYMEVYEGDE